MGINYVVTDASTGQPIQGVLCEATSQIGGAGDGASAFTGADGKVFVDIPGQLVRWAGVGKAGYVTQTLNYPPYTWTVAMIPTAVVYELLFNVAGTGTGTISALLNGTPIDVTQIIQAPQNAILVVNAMPGSGSYLDHWLANNQDIAPVGNSLTATITGNVTIYAVFTVSYTLVIKAGTGGTTNPAPGTYPTTQGKEWTVGMTPSSGYEGDHWMVNGNSIGAGTIVFNTVSPNTVAEAYFKKVGGGDGTGTYTTWPVERSLVLVDENLVADLIHSTGMWKDSPTFDIGDPDVYLGARMEYTITCVSGRTGLLGANAGISVNGTEVVHHDGFQVGDVFSGIKDIPVTLAAAGNKLNFGQTNSIFNQNEFSYKIKIVFGYSAEPKVDPKKSSTPFELSLTQLGLIAVGSVAGVYLIGKAIGGRGGGQPIIVVGGYPQQSPR